MSYSPSGEKAAIHFLQIDSGTGEQNQQFTGSPFVVSLKMVGRRELPRTNIDYFN